MNFFKYSRRNLFALILLLLAMPSLSQSIEDPYQKIEAISQHLVGIIDAHQKDYPKNYPKNNKIILKKILLVCDYLMDISAAFRSKISTKDHNICFY